MKTVPSTKYARNNREIARVFGLPDSRKQLAEIGEWLCRPDFPKKSVRGFLVDELLKWAEKVAPEFAKKKLLSTALSAITKPLKKSELELIQKISMSAGGEDGVTAGLPTQAQGQPAIAALICSHFKMRCQRQDIQKWRALAPEPFPAPDEGNRYHVAQCLDWVQRNIMGNRNGNSTPELFKRAEEATAWNEIESLEHERWEREVERGAYIKRDEAKRTSVGCLKKYHGFVRAELERNDPNARREKLRELGVTSEVMAAIYEFDIEQARAAVDRIEEQCAGLAREVG